MEKLEISDIKQVQADILKAFASYCEANDLTYYLAYGTLIGAIRHQGYIPWDDDIDVIMPRPEYDRFIHSFYDSRYKLFCPEFDKECPFTYGKLYDSHTLIKENSTRHYEIGLNIDIFVLDGLPKGEHESAKHIKRISYGIDILEIKRIAFNLRRGFLKNAELFFLKAITFVFPYRWVRDRVIRFSKKYSFNNSDYCADLCYSGSLRLHKKIFEPGSVGVFEGREYSIPYGYDRWLSRYYGDYMQLPPIEKRITHHAYVAYGK